MKTLKKKKEERKKKKRKNSIIPGHKAVQHKDIQLQFLTEKKSENQDGRILR